jgi:ACS family hexuronate transporter-like MFS transporter
MKLRGLRWWIVALLFGAAVLNYVDRNSLALLAPTIQTQLGFDDQAYARIQNAFQIAYTVALLASGFMVDRFGARFSLALFVAWWSLASFLTGWANSVFMLGICWFMLGLGEAGNWTAAPKAVQEWFPARERGFAMGLYTAGTPLGMTLAPIFVVGLAGVSGWRTVFWTVGILGFLWVIPWSWLYRPIKTHPLLGDEERNGIQSDLTGSNATIASTTAWTWTEALGRKEVWFLLLGRMFSDPVWFFYLNWYPKYLVSVRGLTQAQVKITWVMFLAAGVGSIIGGWFAGQLIRRGAGAERARLFTMLGCVAVMPLSLLVARVPTMEASLALASIIVFAHLAWLANISALVVDVVPAASLGKVFGLVAAGSSAGAIVMNGLVASFLKQGSYNQWFVIAAFLHICAWLCLSPLLRRKIATSEFKQR